MRKILLTKLIFYILLQSIVSFQGQGSEPYTASFIQEQNLLSFSQNPYVLYNTSKAESIRLAEDFNTFIQGITYAYQEQSFLKNIPAKLLPSYVEIAIHEHTLQEKWGI